MPSSTSVAVLRYPKPEPIGCCGVATPSAYEAEAVRTRPRLRAAADVELGENPRHVGARGREARGLDGPAAGRAALSPREEALGAHDRLALGLGVTEIAGAPGGLRLHAGAGLGQVGDARQVLGAELDRVERVVDR